MPRSEPAGSSWRQRDLILLVGAHGVVDTVNKEALETGTQLRVT